MTNIRPISDLRNHFAEISKLVHETSEPVYLTKNGYGDMIVLSIEAYEKLKHESEMYLKMKEAADKNIEKNFSHEKIASRIRKGIIYKSKKKKIQE